MISLVMALTTILYADADLPEELTFMTPLVGDEAALVDAVRTYDRRESAFAAFEIKFAKEDAMKGRLDEAKEKQQSAKKRYGLIRQAYEFTLQRYPKNPRAMNYYAELLYDQFDDQDVAVKKWQEATVLDPKFSPPFNNLAIYYCHRGDYRLGLQYYDQALELDPKNPDYLFNLAQVYLINFPQVGEIRGWSRERIFKEAMRLSKQATRLSPNDFELAQDYAVNFFAGMNLGVTPNWTEAAEAWRRARSLTTSRDQTFYTWLNEARVWIRAGNKSKATECLHMAMTFKPDDRLVKDLLEKIKEREPQAVGHERNSKP